MNKKAPHIAGLLTCAHGETRTPKPRRHHPLKMACLPVSPRAQANSAKPIQNTLHLKASRTRFSGTKVGICTASTKRAYQFLKGNLRQKISTQKALPARQNSRKAHSCLVYRCKQLQIGLCPAYAKFSANRRI